MNRFLLIVLGLFFIFQVDTPIAYAQKIKNQQDTTNTPGPQNVGTANSAATDLQNFYKDIIPISPNAASLGSYGEVPVSLYTGTPNINIPLYALSGIELKLPMSLSYRASGIRVEENASWVGLGWSLEAGGVITRTVRGKEELRAESDKMYPPRAALPLLSATQAQKNVTFSELQDFSTNSNYDFEPDVFNYNFMGLSGSFVFDNTGHAKFSNSSNYKVSFTNSDLNAVGLFTITTDNGTVYEFKETETTFANVSSTTAWYLTRVTSPTGKEVINFIYSAEHYGYYTPPRYAKMITPSGTDMYAPYLQPQNFAIGQSLICNKITISGKRLSQIVFQGIGTVEFVPSASVRSDLGESVNDAKYLDELLVKDLVGNVKKRFDFAYEYVETNQPYSGFSGTAGCPTSGTATNYLNKRLYLTSVTDKSSLTDAHQNPVHTFKYYDRTTNGKDGLPHKLSPSQDHWGFYNSALNADLWPGFCGPWGDADGFLVPGQRCSPGGGVYSMPIWRIATGADRSPNYPAMRSGTLQSIQYPTSGTTEFAYEPNTYAFVGSGSPRPYEANCGNNLAGGLRIKEINSKINDVAVKSTEYTYGDGVLRAQPFYYTYFYVTPNQKSIYPNCSQESGPNQYPDFKLYAEVNCGPINDVGYRNGSHIGYTQVTERQFTRSGSSKVYNGSTEYQYRTERDNPTGPSSEDKRSYIFNHPGDPIMVQEDPFENQYVYPYFPGRNLDWSLGQLLTKTVKNSANQTVLEQENYYTNDEVSAIPAAKAFVVRPDVDYIYTNYNFIEGWPKLTSQVETSYDITGQNGINVTKTFTYGSANHKYLTSELIMGSDNALIETEHRYIEDYTNTAMGGVIGTLKGKQILAKEVDTRTKKRGLTVHGSVVDYNADGQPASAYVLETTSPVTIGFDASSTVPSTLYKKREDYSYDNKRLQTVTKYDGASMTYLWGYGYMRTVAEIKNATYAQVAATGANLTQLNNATVTDSDIRSVLSTVRQGLTTSLVKGYTHNLIYGVSSETDPSELTTYYSYDQGGRLSQILNDKSQVVKEYAYNYGDASTGTGGDPSGGNQSPYSTNTIQDQIFTINQAMNYALPANIFTDPEGQQLTYTVSGLPAGLSYANGAISGTPTMAGLYQVTITATDPTGLTGNTSFFLTVSTCLIADPYIVSGIYSATTPVTFNALDRIESDANLGVIVNQNASLILKAGQSVKLKSGFVIKPGAAFRAYTGPCN